MLTLQLSAYPHLLLLLSMGSTVLLLRTADDYASGCHCCKIFDIYGARRSLRAAPVRVNSAFRAHFTHGFSAL